MKILVHSNAPWAGTGYGQQTGMFAKLAKQAGHDVAISAFYGLHGAVLSWDDIPVYPGGFDAYGNDVILGHANQFFQGGPGLILTLVDFWVIGAEQLTRADVAAWVPVDHDPVPPMVAERLEAAGATPIAMSRFGERMLTQAGLSPLYAPHAIDTTVFRPYGQREARGELGIPQDRFVVGMVAANKGYPPRKSFSQAILAFKAFLNDHPDALLYLHTEPNGAIQGLNINELCRTLELPPNNIAISDTYGSQILGWPAHMVAKLHSSFDVLLSPSKGEGFGIPIVEAQACGTPVIVTDHTAMTELCGAGWMVDGDLEFTDQRAFVKVPRIGDIVDALDNAYRQRGKESIANQAREFALAYDQHTVWNQHWEPVLAQLEPGMEMAA